MKRSYQNTATESVIFFVGEEVEHTVMYGQKTLFVVGIHPMALVERVAQSAAVKHVYLGANQSFKPELEFVDMARHLLEIGYWVTLDYPVFYQNWLNHHTDVVKHNRFIAMISVALPNLKNLNNNTTIKIDDVGFNATNPGVWCHRLSNLMKPNQFTAWENYTQDHIIEVDKL